MPKSDIDVLVVGAGPAGATCAGQLKRCGMNVLLIDKATFPRDKVCAGWITPQVLQSLGLDSQDYAQTCTLQPITGFRVDLIGHSSVNIDYGSVVSYGIRRCEFDNYLLRRSGVRVIEGETVSSIERRPDGWEINGVIHARMLVGAGGHFCPVARWLRRGDHQTADAARIGPVVAAEEVEFMMSDTEVKSCSVNPFVPELYFYPDFMGYAWCFRKGNILNIGLGRIAERHLKAHQDDLLRWLTRTGRIGRIPDQRFKGHAYRLNVTPRLPLVRDRLMLIGDAAGLADVRSGEGIRPAIESGLIAAEVIASGRDDYPAGHLQQFVDQLNERLAPAADGRSAISKVRSMAGRWLLSQAWFVRHVVLDKWFLNRTLPAYRPLCSQAGGYSSSC